MSAFHWFLYIVVVTVSLALHEVGHWAELTRQGIRTTKITFGLGPSVRLFGCIHLGIFPLGASVSPEPAAWAAASPHNRFRVALAGPLASFTCAALFLALSFSYPSARAGLQALATLHFVIGAFNVIPIPPMDGWHILTELMAHHNKPLPANLSAMAMRLGNGLIYGIGFWYVGGVVTGLY